MSGVLVDGRKTRIDSWVIVAAGVAVATGMMVLLLVQFPKSLVTWALGAGVASFAIVMYFNPRHWLKRRSGACLGIAGAAAAIPSVAGAINLPQGWIEISTDSMPWVVGLFGLLSLGFAWLDRASDPRAVLESTGRIEDSLSDMRTEQLSQTERLKVIAEQMERLAGASEEEIAKKLRPLIEQQLRAQFDQQLAEKDRTVQTLLDGLVTAARKGDAIEQVRKSGDGRTIVAALRDISVADEESLVQRYREIAQWSHLIGEIDQAKQSLQLILRLRPNDVDAINRLGHIHSLRGQLAEAEAAYRRVLEFSRDSGPGQAIAYGNLGNVMQTRGDLAVAETMYRKSLALSERLGDQAQIASAYGNLALLMETRGDMDGAEAMFRKALVIEEKLGQLESMAVQYGNLGLLMGTRGDFEGAETMHRKALAISEKLGRLEGMATSYSNLGLIMQSRSDLDGAEAMYRKALAINEKLGGLERMAIGYGNVGTIMAARHDLDGAEMMFRKSAAINEKLGLLEGMARDYGNLGNIMHERGDPAGAEAMYRKSLEISEARGMIESSAHLYLNLGITRHDRGDFAGALKMWTKSRDLCAKLRAKHMVEEVQGWIDRLPK